MEIETAQKSWVWRTPPRPTFQANLVVFTAFFLTFWNLEFKAFSGDRKLYFFASLVGILDLGFCKECMQNVFFPKSKIQDPRVAEKSCAKGPRVAEKSCAKGPPPWIQEVFPEPWILNLESYPLGFKNYFLESWILNPTSLDSRSFFWALNLESWILPP